jgi:DNA-binding response OmpR family regulator
MRLDGPIPAIPDTGEKFMSTGRNVLIIEDDKDLVRTMKVVFESRDFNVRTAYNGKDGSVAIREKKPDAIVLDVMMATLTDGFDLAHYLKDNPEYQDIPIIMVTGFPKEMTKLGTENFQSVLADGWPAAKFLEKPVDPEKIVATVEAILKEQWKP